MINEMSNKKNQNQDAIERVRAINTDALGLYNAEGYQSSTPKKSFREAQQQQAKGLGGPGQFGTLNPEGYSTEFNLGGGDEAHFDIPHHGGNLSLEQ